MTARIFHLPEPTSVATLRAMTEDALAHGRLDDARRFDDERHAAQVRQWRLKADRAARRLAEAQDPRRRVGALLRLLERASEGNGAAQ